MNLNQYNTQKHQAGTMEYAAQRELAGRLALLNGLIGNPVSAPTPVLDRDQVEQFKLHGRHIRSKAITTAIRKSYRASATLFASLLEKRRQRHTLRQHIAELRALDDRTLSDIGMVRGDITALASGTITEEEINQNRSPGGRPEVRLASSKPNTKPASDRVSGHCTALVEHAA